MAALAFVMKNTQQAFCFMWNPTDRRDKGVLDPGRMIKQYILYIYNFNVSKI